MAENINKEFSEFECDQIGFRIGDATEALIMTLIGSMEEELESKQMTKKGVGVVVKRRVRGTGNGTVKVSGHMPWDIYCSLYAMTLDTLVDGVKAYGTNSIHPNFCMTAHVTNEDSEEKFKAYPNCVMTSGIARKVENGAEEVAELELEISITPDEYGNGMYEARAEDLAENAQLAGDWMSKFEPGMAQVPKV